ncbi:MAG: DsrE family protein [Methanobacterium sp.]|uniref:DsrH/TusB family sulfur metabolism protein n=1 Tax=Methanobacterium sp. TaxID=2164 RepID=UPI003D6565C5|nr:DsrE family protein [Methanobacterium sp.]
MHIGLILTKTPAEEGFKTFLEFANIYHGKEEISIYFIGNGVFSARKGHSNQGEIEKLIENTQIYANSGDLKARGIEKDDLIGGIMLLEGYDDLVINIMEKFDQILSF